MGCRVVVTGVGFENKGAEAMLLAVREYLAQHLPRASCCMVVATDSDAAKARDRGICPIRVTGTSLRRRWVLLLALLGIRRRARVTDGDLAKGLDSMFPVVDVIVDAGGYVSSDQWGIRPALSRFFCCLQARAHRVPVLFLTQSWGPFRGFWIRHLTAWSARRAELVVARDELSLGHLKGLGGLAEDKLLWAPDLALPMAASGLDAQSSIFPKCGIPAEAKTVIGMTPNMNCYKRSEGTGTGNRYVRLATHVARHILESTDAHLLLIPHEMHDLARDDRLLIRLIQEGIGDHERMHCLREDLGARDLKAVVGALDFLVASRYHSVIAAVSMGTPVLVIGWAHKYDELLRAIGLDELLVDHRNADVTEAAARFDEAFAGREKIRSAMRSRGRAVKNASQKPLELAVEIISRLQARRQTRS